MRLFVYLIVSLLLVSSVSAIEGTMTLLTVINENATKGGTASVKLEIVEGTGRVFMDSYPLSGVDTQISARYSREVACDFLELDCSRLDFFYTIRSNSNLVTGPSAGGAFATLAVALLDGKTIRDDVAMTGTINSGGTIGAVGGVQAKVDAAASAGFNAVIIPEFGPDNITSTINLVRAKSIEDSLFVFTGKNYSKKYVLQENQEYEGMMRQVASNICGKTEEFLDQDLDVYSADYNTSMRFINFSKSSLAKNDYYSAASFCFSANLRLRTLILENDDNLLPEYETLKKGIDNFDKNLARIPLRKLSELETYMIVKERIDESRDVLDELNKSNISARELAYAIERYNSAVTWSEFFDMDGKEMELDSKYLQEACSNKIDETEERVNLIQTLLPTYNNPELDGAKNSKNEEQYSICLFRATKAKAEINAIIDGISVNINKSEELVAGKLELARKAIAKEQSTGSFPILAFSYYNYANALKSEDPSNALIFSEYALEFSDLGIYFPQDLEYAVVESSSNNYDMFFAGLVVGIAISLMLLLIIKPGRNPRKKASPRKKR